MRTASRRRTALLIAVCSAALLLAACSGDRHEWQGTVYPKTGVEPFDLRIGHFETLEQCRAAALAILTKTVPEPGAAPDYECGRNCETSKVVPLPGQLPTLVCDETAK
jgi:hypothetical protein